ncbi:MAG TPA: alpha/beta fold hydrolase [Xanthobacteraceae bacterium]|nr:alpha/beta fold hydrolase [Xanthobacteraceae bacterium]
MIYSFENYSLDVDRRELHRGGEPVAVEPQVFDVLAYLISHRDRVISNNDLIASVWNGRIVSESTLSSRIAAVRQAVGDNGERQCVIRTIPRKGYRFIAQVRENSDAAAGLDAMAKNAAALTASVSATRPKQAVTFCRTMDGINLAVASVGCGPVLVRAAHWATHIEYDWQNPATGPLLQRLADRFRLVRYDARSCGLSDREVPSISLQTMLYDLEAVVDALALERFALLGISGGAATSIAYAVRHPHRISKLVLFGGYAQGRNKRDSPQDAEEAQAFLTMSRHGWGDDRLIFARAFFSFWLPAGSPEQLKSFIELARVSVSDPRTNVNLRRAVDDIDIVDLLPRVSVPTIVFHCIHDRLVPFDHGRRLAASIPTARFVPLDSENHALLADEPAWAKFVGEMEAFLADGS